MPRKIKKVKVARGQRPAHSKKFFAILFSSIFVGILAIVAAIILIVHFVNKDEDEYDYFSEITEEYQLTWNSASKKISNTDNMLIFYWDESSFDPDDNTSDKELETNITTLYKKVLDYNTTKKGTANFESIDFCLVNTKDKRGQQALSDSKSGVTATNQLAYYYEGTKATRPFGNDEEKAEKTEGIVDLKRDMTSVTEVIAFVLDLYKL